MPQLIRKLAIPAGIGFFFHTLFNVVDNFFGGKISTDALAALSISFPVFFIIIAISAGSGTGTTALISRALGAGDRKKAVRLVGQSLTFGLLLSIAITLIGWFCAPGLFYLLGAEGVYLEFALKYIT